MSTKRIQYRNHTIEIEMVSGAGLWSAAAYRNADKQEMWADGGYSRRAAAMRDARYVIDNAVDGTGEAE